MRDLDVERDYPEIVVLPSGDSTRKMAHTGNRVVVSDPTQDSVVERAANSGAYS